MSGDLLFKPKHYPARKPTDVRLHNGAVLNPPRMSEVGGLDALHKGSIKHNLMALKKPGGTK